MEEDFDLELDLQDPYGLDTVPDVYGTAEDHDQLDTTYLRPNEQEEDLQDLNLAPVATGGVPQDTQFLEDEGRGGGDYASQYLLNNNKAVNGNILDPNKSEAGLLRCAESMRSYFEKFGPVDDCVVMKDPATTRSRGFGFLTFRDPRSVEEVVQLEHTLDGKIIDPKRAIPREEQEKTEKIFVGGVGADVSEDQFREYFMRFGKVIDATLMIDRESGRPRGFGFITFENSDGVDKAMAKQSMGELAINDKPVEVKRAMPKHKIAGPGATGGIPQTIRFGGRGEGFTPGDGRAAPGFGPMRTRMGGYPADAMGMRMVGGMGPSPGRYGYPPGGAAGYPRAYPPVAGGGAPYGYPMYGAARYPAESTGGGGYGMMEGYGGGYPRTAPNPMAAYYPQRGFGGPSGGAPYGYGGYPPPQGYGGGGYGGGGARGSGSADPYGGRPQQPIPPTYGQDGYPLDRGYSPGGSPGGDEGGGGGAYRDMSPGPRHEDYEASDSVELTGGDLVDVKPQMGPSGPRFEREPRDYPSRRDDHKFGIQLAIK
ncbi:hypothetical protein HKX48_002027 [Thoreauomyces humboldtii]|nr:hypothetical protein HKX48_002027 [Thoreauomyces humboldtii]